MLKENDHGNYDITDSPNGAKNIFVDGIEIKLLITFCELYNCTIKVKPEVDWGESYENGTGFGIMGSVAKHEADFGLSANFLDWYSWKVIWVVN